MDQRQPDNTNIPPTPQLYKTQTESAPVAGQSKVVVWVRRILHIFVLILSIYLLVAISMDTFQGQGIEDYHKPNFLKTQVFICIVFLVDFFVELFLADRKWHFLFTHFIFLVVSIPYLWIIHHFGFDHISPKTAYLIQYIPLVRGGYALALVVGWLTSSRAANLFATYLISLMATVYFASLAFFMFEQNVNQNVQSYGDALYWACMDMTTVGSNIEAITPLGRVLSVLLAALGMMMFPIFTVYITSIVQGHRRHITHKQQG